MLSWSILQYFWSALSDSLENQFLVFFLWPLKTGFTALASGDLCRLLTAFANNLEPECWSWSRFKLFDTDSVPERMFWKTLIRPGTPITSRHDWKNVDWDVKNQIKQQPKKSAGNNNHTESNQTTITKVSIRQQKHEKLLSMQKVKCEGIVPVCLHYGPVAVIKTWKIRSDRLKKMDICFNNNNRGRCVHVGFAFVLFKMISCYKCEDVTLLIFSFS